MSVSSVVLDLAFAWLSRGNTDANVKSTTLAMNSNERPGERITLKALQQVHANPAMRSHELGWPSITKRPRLFRRSSHSI